MAQITVEEFRNFFKYYKGEEHQQRAIEMLYEEIDCMFADHLAEDVAWIQQYRTPDKAPAGEPVGGVVTPFLMEQLNGLSSQQLRRSFLQRLQSFIQRYWFR